MSRDNTKDHLSIFAESKFCDDTVETIIVHVF
jgi:hypothetical protein